MGSTFTETPRAWWKESTVYQIYTPSFKYSNGDGIGDLRGVISKLDYIQNLGVDIVWLNPVSKWQNFMHDNNGWNALYLENHDQPRAVSRFAIDDPQYRAPSAKLLATFLGFQSGTPFIYQGQELGMANVPRDWTIDHYRDIETLNHWNELLASHPNDTALQEAALVEFRKKSRDNARTPMQWDESANSGFTTGDPWITIHEDYRTWNAAAQLATTESVYYYWGTVLRLRKRFPDIFEYGSFELVSPDDPNVFAYARHSASGSALVVLNFQAREVKWTMPVKWFGNDTSWEVCLSNHARTKAPTAGEAISLAPLEAFVMLNVSRYSRPQL